MKRRVLKLLLAIALLCCVIPVVASASESCSSNYYGGGKHYWSGGHDGYCVYCRTPAPTECEFECVPVSPYNSTKHYEKCTICGKTCNEADHNLQYKKSSYTGYHVACCTECGYEGNSSRCTYQGYQSADGQHWQVCTVCIQETAKTDCTSWSSAEHIAGTDTHSFTCDTCKNVSIVECTYGNWKYTPYGTDNGHYRVCSACGHETEKEAHSEFKYEASYSGDTHTKKCGICGKTVVNGESCVYEGYAEKSKSDATYHYQTCTLCKKEISTRHHFVNLKCACGAEKHEHHWVVTASGDTITVTCDCETGTCEYDKNGGTLKISVEDLTNGKVEYNGEAKAATVENTIHTGDTNYDRYYTVTYYKKTVGSYGYGTTTAPTNVGQYKAEVYCSRDSSQKAYVEFEIKQAELTVTATGYEGTYDGEYHGITLNVPEGKGLTVKYSENGENYYQYSVPKYKDAGEYAVYYEVTDSSGNYLVKDGKNSAVVKIAQADLTTLISAENYIGEYDGKAHGITVKVPDNVSVVYSEDGTNYNKYYNPTYTDVVDGKTVYYKAKVSSYDEKNFINNEVTGNATVTITQLDLADVLNITAEDTTFTYNRYDHELNPSYVSHAIKLEVMDKNNNAVTYVPGVAYNNYITIEYSKDDGATWSTQNPAFTDAGEYPVQYRIYVKNEETNIKGITNFQKVTINQAVLPFDSLRGYSGYYDGTYHYTFGYAVDDGNQWGYTYWPYYLLDELTYSFSWTDDDGNAKTSEVIGRDYFVNYYEGRIPGFKKQNVASLNADGGKVVTVTISGKNYIEGTFSYTVKIGPGRASANNYEGEYDGQTHYITNYAPFGAEGKYKAAGTEQWLPASQEPGRKDEGQTDIDWRMSFDSDGDGRIGGYNANKQADNAGIYNSFGNKEVITGTNYVKITPAKIVVTAKDHTINIDQEPTNNGYTITGFKGSDTEGLLVGEAAYTYTEGDDGNYTIHISGLSLPEGNTNYTIEYVDGKLTVVDNVPPVIEGIETGKNYSEDTTFTVTDKNLDKVTMDGNVLEPNEDGTYTLPSDNGEHTIVATDKVGNTTTVTVTTKKIYTVTADPAEGTKVTGAATVMHGNSYDFTVEIESGYRKTSAFAVTVSGKYGDVTGNYTVSTVVSNLHITVTGVEKIPYHNVTASQDEGYSVKGEPSVKDGDTYKFYVDINSGYKKGDDFKVTVNGNEVKPNLLGQYVVEAVHENLRIEVSGVVKKPAAVVKKEGPTETPFTGDTFNLAFWGTVMASTLVLAIAAVVFLMKAIRYKDKYHK